MAPVDTTQLSFNGVMMLITIGKSRTQVTVNHQSDFTASLGMAYYRLFYHALHFLIWSSF